jgi:rhodanese-related sulfurtransferase
LEIGMSDSRQSELEARVKKLPPAEAWELVQRDPRAVLIDVRSSMEHLFVGHPKGAIHISWIDEPEWKINPHFVQDVRKVLLGGVSAHDNGAAPVILICRSGYRSLEAGAALLADGFESVFSVDGGFEGPLNAEHHRSKVAGWRHAELPWEQS